MCKISILSKLILDLDEKTRTTEKAKQLLQVLAQTKMDPIEGERWILERFERRSQRGHELLHGIAKTESAPECNELLQELHALLEEVGWELLRDVVLALEEKVAAQEARLRGYNDLLAQWCSFLDILGQDLLNARNEGVPLLEDERFRLRMGGLIKSLGRAIQDQNFLAVSGLILEIKKNDQRDKYNTEQIDQRVRGRRSFALQADLLLLRPPASTSTEILEYTVLLRTPSRPGSHGVNIHGTSTIVKADRDRLIGLFHKISQIFHSSVRQRNSPLELEPQVTQSGSLDANQARHLYPGSTTANVPSTNLNALLKEVGNFMFRLFMPDQIIQFLNSHRCSLTLTTNDLELPWELMLSGGGSKNKEFLCLDRPVARLPMGYVTPRLDFPDPVARAKKHFLLIYSDPDNKLPAARKEVDAIKASLDKKWKEDVEVLALSAEEVTGDRLNEVLRTNLFDVIHYAGHASFNTTKPDLSALLLSGHEPFFAQKIRRLLNGRPLVFLNACQSAVTSNPEHAPEVRYELQEAEGLAAAFIYGGALGCLGAIWPVFDGPAAEFAIAFYDKVLEGEMIGEAVRQARLAVHDRHGITWASFILYGDPTFRVFS